MAENYHSSAYREMSICSNNGVARLSRSSILLPKENNNNFTSVIPYPELDASQPDVLPANVRKALIRTLQNNKEGFDLLAQ